ncbi:hypothetical protein [Mycobacteroides chelonae]|jgi:hypothetical protein|uniref:hypothetical protein n=1 Tax=Mycobacteroides chelonae TaxID=1774 RepID=UPI0008AA5ACD|nr:hypothetical protein [Mycobacteroides chelonae]MEC4834387.1 hypothetical protein [Mycobacteroides chelonae]MEC4856693.1 hypothetical protein [Mycobacteroides chelonae]MEC4873115.1 hypothetical protein [Mycobacteroides chelonae]MEC4901608.1 hypothetical protein [Mycobacteroides chelonae]OHT50340.1 hypothetical protein BKG63_20310 [Mycobacteroides chelonae]
MTATATPNLCDLAIAAGLTISSTSLELTRIASSVAYTEFIPLSPYETTRALLRIQRDMRAQQASAATESDEVAA